jgi:putative FmdB family regulatory protein
MPTYDYQCDACSHTFELFQGINEPVQKKCPQCRKNKLRRLFGTGGAIVFKGSGFYQTDYRSESYKKGAKAEKSAGESKSSDTKTSDTKSEPKASGSASDAKSTPAKSSPGSKSDS